jgi:propanol-preferring alcohol dehydrogenase
MTRGERSRALATELGVDSVQGPRDAPPERLDAAVLFAPVGDLVPVAMEALDRGGRLSIAGIHLTDIPTLGYEKHLFYEREIASVTANTRSDARRFLSLAAAIPLKVSTTVFPLEEAPAALAGLAAGSLAGAAAVLRI